LSSDLLTTACDAFPTTTTACIDTPDVATHVSLRLSSERATCLVGELTFVSPSWHEGELTTSRWLQSSFSSHAVLSTSPDSGSGSYTDGDEVIPAIV